MIRLIKLELQRINLKYYLFTTLMLGIFLLIFIYFVANVAQIEQEIEFMNYENILRFTCVMSLLLYGAFSAIMYNNLVIKEYSPKRLALLFSYPVNRMKIFASKVVVTFLFISISMLLCTSIPITIFLVTESISPIVSDMITTDLLMKTYGMVVISIMFVSAIGVFAMGIGFIRKSITVTLISAFLLSAIYGNISISMNSNLFALLFVVSVSLIAIAVVLIILSNKINHMEAI